MDKLMLEMPSPNVHKIIPMDFLSLKSFPTDFVVTPHENGIFEFDLPIQIDQHVLNIAHAAFDAHEKYIYDVSVTGFKTTIDEYAPKGSTRFCTMNYQFAEFLTKAIKHRSAVDVIKDEQGNWMEMVNVSQYFRFMRYEGGGQHFPHYDSDFEYEYNKTFTKYSLVVYFTRCQTGELAFVNNNGHEFEGLTTDWNRQATDEEIYLKILPTPMKIVVFPHTLCHTVLPFTDKGSERIICRGDILYKKV